MDIKDKTIETAKKEAKTPGKKWIFIDSWNRNPFMDEAHKELEIPIIMK